MIKVGLIGCGAIGGIIARQKSNIDIVALYDSLPERAHQLAVELEGATVYTDLDGFLDGDFDMVIEAASITAVQGYAEAILQHGRDLIILSVGALADTPFKQRLESLAGSMARKIHIPSGALFGIDNLKVGRLSGLDTLILRTTKSPASLGRRVERKTLLFSGSAEECIRLYPRNINVAVTLSLAAETPVAVELWVDPTITRNIHELIVSGDFGDASILVQNVPSPDNPATSYLAALSILSLLDDLQRPISIGT